MALDSIPPDVLNHLEPAIPTLKDVLRVQMQMIFAPIVRHLEAYLLK